MSTSIAVIATDSVPQLVVGRTYYVMANALHVRARPVADEPGNPRSILVRNRAVTVLEVPNRNRAFVHCFGGADYAIDGYVSRWYLAEKPVE